tara:strand:- start:631 stop:1536 length:906 start_codon:yes stop_codon:yes gene_type:complete
LKVTVLGSQGAIPKVGLFSSSLVLNVSRTNILIDCCEGAQFQLRKNKIKLSKIEIILISHAHGDHYFGLIGLISTLSLMKRDKKLTLFCPLSVLKIVQAHLKYSNMNLSYELEMKVLNNQSRIKILDNNQFSIYAFPLKHSVYTNGFLIREKEKKRKLILEKALENNIDKIYFNKLTKRENVINNDGVEINYMDVTKPAEKPRAFAYCSDTAYFDELINYIKGVDLLYCETTFLKKDKDKAALTLHSTTLDAAKLAKKGRVKKLLIGHFSSRYDDDNVFNTEASSIFENVIISEEGKKIEV